MVFMRMPGKLVRMAEARGVTVLELITQTIEDEGSVLSAAQKLECAPNAINYHLKKGRKRVRIESKPRARVVDL